MATRNETSLTTRMAFITDGQQLGLLWTEACQVPVPACRRQEPRKRRLQRPRVRRQAQARLSGQQRLSSTSFQ